MISNRPSGAKRQRHARLPHDAIAARECALQASL
jgi:hypothetical protein